MLYLMVRTFGGLITTRQRRGVSVFFIKTTADIARQDKVIPAGSVGRCDWEIADAYPTLFYGQDSCWLVPMTIATVLAVGSDEYNQLICHVCLGVGGGELHWMNPASYAEEIEYNAEICWMCQGSGVMPDYMVAYPND